MNKGVVIGVAVGIIVVIIGITLSSSSESNNDETIKEVTDLETSSVENVPEEPESTGIEFSVELTESIGLKSP